MWFTNCEVPFLQLAFTNAVVRCLSSELQTHEKPDLDHDATTFHQRYEL